MKHFVRHIILFLMIATVTSCYDEFMKQEFIGEGKASISATLDFKPMSSALSRTRAAGDALKDINSLHVLLYGEDKKLIKNWKIEEYTVSNEGRNDSDAENGSSAETSTKRATFKLPEEIGFGKYYMYAVANIPDLLTNSAYSEAIKTVDGLKNIPLTWDSEDVANNGQMIGFFTKSSAPALSADDESLIVNEKSVKLHAWLRRAASKVTVAFDGSKLKEGVFIYLQSVQIKDIPSQCYLGKENNVGKEGYTLAVPENGPDMIDGEIITYHEGDKAEDFEYGEGCADHRVTVGSPHFGSHDETAPALYFYENMQGAGDNMPDKRQDADGNGSLDHPGLPDDATYRLKDAVPYGTYIEVHAHYISNNSERLGNGHIIYRFMLGQDVINDYNAKRNCHYKLTLKFKNFANEADWHIEYEEPEPGVMTPEPYYISYLYNHSMMYPIKVNTGGHEIESITAEIIDNRWAPHNANPAAAPPIYFSEMDKEGENKWNGFLSLHKTTMTVLPAPPGQLSEESNKEYYEDPPKRGLREYKKFTVGEHTTSGSLDVDTYRVEKHSTEANTYNVFIPMYTRAKQMISTTGYTGNNPFVAYQRKAVVRITTKLKDVPEAFVNTVPIYQVRRVVNPKGIYRSAGNNTPFHVVLKRLPREEATEFQTFQSEGPWKAYVVAQDNGASITLSASGGSELQDGTIYGKTGSVIDFNVNFNGQVDDENHYAIIRVEYHNYTCQHLIFVRQGNKPDALLTGGTRWYAENMRTKTERASSPLDEGSLFKCGNWDYPIDASNNKNSRIPWINVYPTDFVLYPSGGFVIAGKEDEGKKLWSTITFSNSFSIPASGMRVARLADYMALLNSSDIEQGYGILYGDDATETADNIENAYGYDYKNNNKGRGMRGCFAYNKLTGKNLFFPIGASGYGHRRRSDKTPGMLRYSAGRTEYYPENEPHPWGNSRVKDRPLFYDLFRRPGAIYWIDKETNQKLGWDINYFTFDFNSIDATNIFDSDDSDACFVRCVVDP
ncbi:hypothetical protein [uncultured Phocaeicola sp.]|uniref:hypothetical protein n=1 Tax=uncultured Phocaeicola sp. TaxID=990718 RepID=UPI002590BD5D|nr:hypothetical protein [uncultured Phocaeicola sp.]